MPPDFIYGLFPPAAKRESSAESVTNGDALVLTFPLSSPSPTSRIIAAVDVTEG
jgi:hypothetical protein